MLTHRQPLEAMVRRFQRYAGLSPEDCRLLRELPFKLRELQPSAYFIREADAPTHCGLLVSGFAFRQKVTGDGARQIVGLYMPGDAIDLQNLFLEVADHSVQTLTPAEICYIPREALRDLALSRPKIAHALSVAAVIDGSIFREWVLNVGRRDSRTRMAHLLCEVAVRLQSDQIADDFAFDLPMTQEQLADALGLTSVHVNRTLQSLEADGLISRSRRRVTIPDWKQLRDAGDFNQRYLHLDQQPQAA
ncbi:MAG: Crp/Fnr family transcriptional regulator [Pseudomonadota bacterium]|nr:Crp/Fnr family transcriptional regulator [Pseudomonadota bacterium]